MATYLLLVSLVIYSKHVIIIYAYMSALLLCCSPRFPSRFSTVFQITAWDDQLMYSGFFAICIANAVVIVFVIYSFGQDEDEDESEGSSPPDDVLGERQKQD